ncbi:zinc finger CCCH domain-containing protein 13 isoform X2 [Pseudomyrmex gracilis]|uniref:zinc finger CCCH domain-containing protein 13 isoform X2 n=1 Tax=Pseudomyrmex gracilis TaxID=219809 RepID=UPI0009958531|nr:zinc finger CCCH domain-containing protein 13 isoform X2 [Pseudomyrmex gracilis]
METEELTRLVDEIYKNILDKFNPGARQLINAGKAYLKALHGAAAASRVYVDALSRLARQAQLGTWGGSKDVGFALMRIVEVYKEIQDQEMNILKAFYVDLLVPLETNLEKDTKVVQSEQKKFLQQHKTRSETYSKAAATMKKQRKKSRAANKSGLAMDKELKNMQILEEEKTKLDAFCEQSLKNAMTQERRRYGFVLERQCSLAKHYASFHEVALAALHPSVDKWREVAATREYLPQSVEDMFASRLRQTSFWPEDEENGGSELTTMSSQLRKTRSMDSSCLELRLGPLPGNPSSSGSHLGPAQHLPAALSRARSEANLHASTLSLGPEVPETPPRPRSMAPPTSRSSGGGGGGSIGVSTGGWGDAPLARALFAYLSSGENQLSFLEGDLIALMGDRQKGWQFGENLRTHSSGWFPLAYTEIIIDDTLGHGTSNGRTPEPQAIPPCKPPPSRPPVTPANIDEQSGGTTGAANNSSNTSANNNNNNTSNAGTPTNNASVLATPTARQSKSIRPSSTLPAVLAGGRRVQPPVPPVPPPAMTSLHSSNDSGFSNEPPVQPDVDYSDDEAMRQRRRKPRNGGECQLAKDEKQTKDWENDSWKTIPRDEKSWQLYRTAMDLWAEAKANQASEDSKKYFELENGEFTLENGDITRKRKNKKGMQATNERPSPNQRTKMADERSAPAVTRRGDQRRVDKRTQAETEEDELEEDEEDFEYRNNNKFYADNRDSQQERRSGNNYDANKYTTKSSTSSSDSDDDSTITIPQSGRKVEHIAQKLEQTAQKYAREHSPPKFLERRERTLAAEYKNLEKETRETTLKRDRRERIADYKSLERENRSNGAGNQQKNVERARDDKRLRDEKRLTRNDKHLMERGSREQDHKQQTFERTREDKQHSYERTREEKQNFERTREDKQGFERAREDKQSFERSRDDKQNFERSREDKQNFSRSRGDEAQSYERVRVTRNDQERGYIEQRKEATGYERTFEKNRNKTIERLSSRRFERPRPPSQEAPERPVGPYRERRYSDKEEAIYGETARYGIGSLDRDRGYESNFETKLERTKVIERHGYSAGVHGSDLHKRNGISRNNERSNGDTNNNTLKMERKPLLPRQTTAMGHLAQTGRAFEEPKSPKLVKRTKSFWKFRRDSEVLEGMALWQHRSLVDIPKMIRKEDKTAENEEKQRKDSEDGSPNSSLGNSEITITNEHRHEEPKPAERSHVPDKTDYFEDFPTPAERPKITERSEYRMQQQQHHHHSEERAYFVGNVSRKAIIEKERKRSLEAKRNMIVAELKENENKRNEMMRGRKNYDEEEDATLNFSETEASDEESTYSCIVVKDQSIPEKTLLPRTKLRRDSDRDRNTCGPWYDLWGVDASVKKKKKQKQQ